MKIHFTPKHAILTALASLSLLGLFAQTTPDTLFFHNGRIIPVYVVELGLDEIKYHLPGDDLRVSVERSDVALVKMSDGRQIRIPRSELSAQLSAAAMSRTQVIKFHFLSPAFNHITFGYERVLKPWTNWEVTAGYIGAGFNIDGPRASGFLLRTGVKFISRPDVVVRGMRMAHPLHGRYVKPELLVNSFSSARKEGYYAGSPEHNTDRYTNVGINVVVGKQRFLGDGVTLDTWVGVGYATRLAAPQGLWFGNAHQYSHIYLGSTSPLILSAGLSLGIAFGKAPATK